MLRLPHPVRALLALAFTAVATLFAPGAVPLTTAVAATTASVPGPDHVVVVVFENKDATSILGNPAAPYLNLLADTGANFTQSYAIEHPSQPNYLDLFSGDNQGVTDDSCPHTFSSDNLAAQLIAAGLSFGGYAEGLPAVGSTTCSSGDYVRKHNPWVNFTNVPAEDNMPFSSFPTDYSTLPTVSWVVPDLCNDMHDCGISTGDTWLQANLGGYAQWATTHNSLLIVTFDENDGSAGNQITTLFYGAGVRPGQYAEHIDHFDVLRTLEDMYDLPYAGSAATATPITDVWEVPSTSPLDVTDPGTPYSKVNREITPVQLTTSGGTPPYTWSVSGLPDGLVASPDGLITGTPTTVGTFTVTATVTDSVGASESATFTWTVGRRRHAA